MTSRLRLHIETFGCRVNQYDTDVMRQALQADCTLVDRDPDIIVLNACTVTALAERKARQAARRLRREHPHALLLLIGCLADAVQQGSARFDDADLLAGNDWKPQIADVVRQARAGLRGTLPPCSPRALDKERSAGPTGRIRAFLKIQDGCAHTCTYCRTTLVRGAPRCKSIDAVKREAIELVRLGFPEIVLTGIDLAQYSDTSACLADVVRAVSSLPGLRRLRLGSINPSGISPQLLEVCRTEPVVSPHFHAPLQSGCDAILSAMARRYDRAEYLHTIDRIRAVVPQATLGTDLIVGFPGEDDQAFRKTCDVVRQVGYSNVHIFRYSPRAGTPAATLPGHVAHRVQCERSEILLQTWESTLGRSLDNRIGTTQDLLVEEHREAAWYGYTHDYLNVKLLSDRHIPIGSIASVRITGRSGAVMEGVDEHRANAR